MSDTSSHTSSALGRVYERIEVIDTVVERGKVAGDEQRVVSHARCRELSGSSYALTYRLDQAGRLTRRLTLWRRDADGWRAPYHQGTLIHEP